MLQQLTINNFAIVDQLEIELESGMTVLTGETGAGKSIMLDALGLTLGDRADRDVIRGGAERADITACFTLPDNPDVTHWLKQNDFDTDDNSCILRRVVSKDGRSRAYINGQPTTLVNLRDLGEMLVDIHSQHEHQSLLKTSTHQRLLDDYCGLQQEASEVRTLATKWRQLNAELEQIKNRAEESNAQYQLLSYQVKELEELNLGESELESLDDEHKILSHSESSMQVIQEVLDLSSDNEELNLEQSLNKAVALLQNIPYASKHTEEAGSMLKTALIQVEEATSTLKHAIDQFEIDPQRLEEIDLKLGLIHQLARKHHVSASELSALFLRLSDELSGLSEADVQIELIQEELEKLLSLYRATAGKLSNARDKGASKLSKEINNQLVGLGMESASFSVALTLFSDSTPKISGLEGIEFLVTTNPGQPPRPLVKIASGGELSRISLAIQVVTAQTSSIPSLVFDEVDVGIGGGVAKSVGELLRQLGNKGQVLCVTHQPQVASQGHHHLYVSKSSDKESTATQLKNLNKQERIDEIARMLGGEKISDKSRAHAKELLA
ncbi:MAG: DNA repair protein RecN [Gammaproteobacteria bacterium]|nr:DNA repair protein RecN [Gammaproteobacteria bacterium]